MNRTSIRIIALRFAVASAAAAMALLAPATSALASPTSTTSPAAQVGGQYLGTVGTPSSVQVKLTGPGIYKIRYFYEGVADFTTSVDGTYLGVTPAPWSGQNLASVDSAPFTLTGGTHNATVSFPDGFSYITPYAYLIKG